MSKLVFDDIENFWEWKRNTLKRNFCKGKYELNNFISKWNEIKDIKDDLPKKGSCILTDYYAWKTSGKPKKSFAGPSEPFFTDYYNDRYL